jgi:hypothetical protein
VWAVVPFRNESGVSSVDTLGIADDFVVTIDDVVGLQCIPLNRTIAGLRALGMAGVASDADARALMAVLQVDGLVVGTVTAYDPYRPIELGVAAQLYSAASRSPTAADPDTLTLAIRESTGADQGSNIGPSAQFSRVYSGSNHEVIARVRDFAAGRHQPKSGFRDEIYLSSMTTFRRFVAFEVVGGLISIERPAVSPTPPPNATAGSTSDPAVVSTM